MIQPSLKSSLQSSLQALVHGFTVTAPTGDFVVANQVHSKGALTRAGVKITAFAASTGSIAALMSVTGANAADLSFGLAGNAIEVTTTQGALANGPYNLTVTVQDGQGNELAVPFTLNTKANTYSVDTDGEAKGIAEHPASAYGQTLEYLPGDYNATQDVNNFWKRSAPFAGTFDGTNHFIVKAETASTATIGFLSVDNVNDVNPGIHFQGLNFYRPFLGAPGSGGTGNGSGWPAALMTENSNDKDVNIIVSNCTGGSTDTTVEGSVDIWSAVRLVGNNVTVRDCHFSHVFNGIFTAGEDVTLLRNTITNCRDDGLRVGSSDNQLVEYNIVWANGAIHADQHVDALQLKGSGNQNNVVVRYNKMASYGANNDWQGIYIDDTGDEAFITNLIVEYNIVYNAATNGIYVHRAKGAIFRYNSLIWINGITPPSGGNKFVVSECEDCFFNFNVCEGFANAAGSNNDQTQNTILDWDLPASYTDNLADPQSGPAFTSFDQLNIKAGSAPDLAGHGARQVYELSPPPQEPVVWSALPAGDATGVAADTDLTIKFDKPVQFGTGAVTLYDVTNSAVVEVFEIATDVGTGPGKISIDVATLSINPTADLVASTEYSIRIEPTAIDDFHGNSFAGLSDNSHAFTTSAVVIPPTIHEIVWDGQSRLTNSALGAPVVGNTSKGTIFMNFRPDSVDPGVIAFLLKKENPGQNIIQQQGTGLRMTLEDAADTTIYNTSIDGLFSAAQDNNLIISWDSTVPIMKVRVNDVRHAGFEAGLVQNSEINWKDGSAVTLFGSSWPADDAAYMMAGRSKCAAMFAGEYYDIDSAPVRRLFHDVADGDPTNLAGLATPTFVFDQNAATTTSGTNPGTATDFTKAGSGSIIDAV